MTNAGWYPDPAGRPDHYRYWDGQQWGEDTSADPFGQTPPATPEPAPPVVEEVTEVSEPPIPTVTPVPPQPVNPYPVYQPTPAYQAPQQAPQQTPQPPAYGTLPQPGWSPMPPRTPTPPRGPSTGIVLAIVGGVVVAVVVLIALIVLAVHALSGVDTSSGPAGVATQPTQPTQQPTQPGQQASSPPPAIGSITPTTLQCSGGSLEPGSPPKNRRISAGGISVPVPQGYTYDATDLIGFPFVREGVLMSKQVSTDWMSPLLVGPLPKSNGFTGLEMAARTVVACLAQNPIAYANAYEITDGDGHATKVDGHPAYDLTQQIRVRGLQSGIQGDTLRVIVVDTGNPKNYALFLMGMPVGDKAGYRLMDQVAKGLKAE